VDKSLHCVIEQKSEHFQGAGARANLGADEGADEGADLIVYMSRFSAVGAEIGVGCSVKL